MTNSTTIKRALLRSGSAFQALALLGAGLTTSAIVAVPAVAQDYTRGSLEGTALSSTGEPLSGATVTLRSNAQGFERSTTADANGDFSFNLLPPGTYALQIRGTNGEIIGDPAVPITAGQSANFTYTATGGTAAETAATGDEIVVTGSRVQTSDFAATTTGITLNVQQTVESIPIPRTQTGLILLAPGTSQGDANFADCTDCVSVGGATIAENSYYVNGLNTTNFRTMVGNNTVPFEFYRSFEVKTGGYTAEFGRSLGGVTSAVTKSGSNDFAAGMVLTYQPDALTSDAPNTYQDAEETLLKTRNDTDYTENLAAAFYASGALVKDHVFFYGLYQPRFNKQEDTSVANGFRFVETDKDPFFGGKVDLVFGDHRLEGTYFRDKRDITTDYLGVDSDGEVTGYSGSDVLTQGGDNFIVQYTGQFTDWLTLSAAYGENNYTRRAVSSSDVSVTSSTLGGITRVVAGLPLTSGNPTDGEDNRKVYRVDADVYVSFLGDHHFRLGYDREDLTSEELTFYTNNYAYVFNPTYIRRRLYLNTGSFTSRQQAFYLQDSWDLLDDRLNLQLGIRNDNYRNSSVGGEPYLEMENQWAPRLGASFDVFGDKLTKINAFYGRYYLGVPTNTNIRLAGQELYYEQRFAYAAGVDPTVFDSRGVPEGQEFTADGSPVLGGLTAANTNDCPEVGPDSGSLCTTVFSDGVLGPTDTLVAADLKPMYQDEFIVGISHRMDDWTFGLNYINRRLKQTLEDVAIDAAVLKYCDLGPDGQANSGDEIAGCDDEFSGFHQYVLANPGEDITVRLDGNCEVDARMCDVVTLSADDLGYPKPQRNYDAVEFTARKAFDGLYSLDFSYTWARVRGNYEGSVKSDNNQDDAGLTQDYDQPGLTDGAYGILANEREHTFKLFGFLQPVDWMSIGANLTVQSPRNFSCIGVHPTDEFAAGYQAASFWCRNPAAADAASETFTDGDGVDHYLVNRGTAFQSEWNTNLDLGVQFKLPGDLSGSSFRVDVFNVFNSKAKLDYVEFGDTNAGAARTDYRLVTGYQAPRAVRFTLAMRFGGDTQ
ncbi:TonB-dependent receptor [Sphingomonas gilva]|uniref:TonB-dependent receptor n=1 Tax=Sphingomonas gilva TaxID=2305907 RepID=UPI001FE68326|nr:TonB-dependent receptor [Sphingomonas gilva]